MKCMLVILAVILTSLVTFGAHPSHLYAGTNTTRILCDGQTYDGYTKKPFVLRSAMDQDPSVQKVIRNCTFRNSRLPAIVLWNAQNVLIEGNTFENIRTHVPGKGVHAINISCRGTLVLKESTCPDE